MGRADGVLGVVAAPLAGQSALVVAEHGTVFLVRERAARQDQLQGFLGLRRQGRHGNAARRARAARRGMPALRIAIRHIASLRMSGLFMTIPCMPILGTSGQHMTSSSARGRTGRHACATGTPA